MFIKITTPNKQVTYLNIDQVKEMTHNSSTGVTTIVTVSGAQYQSTDTPERMLQIASSMVKVQ